MKITNKLNLPEFLFDILYFLARYEIFHPPNLSDDGFSSVCMR